VQRGAHYEPNNGQELVARSFTFAEEGVGRDKTVDKVVKELKA
jgi:hypothetical protein